MYTVRGRSALTAATADHAICAVWNPHATQSINLIFFSLYQATSTGAGSIGDSARMRRITARGTPGSTVTPAIQNHSTRGVAPVSGVLLDLAAYSVQPTLDSSDVEFGFVKPGLIAGLGILFPIDDGIIVPPGAGLALIQVAASQWAGSEITVSWLEDW